MQSLTRGGPVQPPRRRGPAPARHHCRDAARNDAEQAHCRGAGV